MNVWHCWRSLFWSGFFGVALIIIGCTGFTGLGHADSEPSERAKKELQRAIEIAFLLDAERVFDPHCPFPNYCSLTILNGGTLEFSVGDTALDSAFGAPFTRKQMGQEVVTCTWLVALLTGVEDLSVAEAIAQELVTDARATKQTVSATVLGVSFTARWWQADYVSCKGKRL